MYILSIQDIQAGVSAGSKITDSECCAPAPGDFNEVLSTIGTRVEEALGVETLRRVECQDTFVIHGYSNDPRLLRLANAFLTSELPVFVDAEGEVVEIQAEVDRKYGIVRVVLQPGKYTVRYTSGFLADDNTKTYKDVPDWMKSIALAVYFLWRRSMNRGVAPKDISHKGLLDGMVRELNARIYNRYDRPRAFVETHLIHERREVGSSGEWLQW